MKKTLGQQQAEVWAKEEQKALSLGFESVYEYRQYLANENRKKAYLAKIARYEQAIAEMKAWLETH